MSSAVVSEILVLHGSPALDPRLARTVQELRRAGHEVRALPVHEIRGSRSAPLTLIADEQAAAATGRLDPTSGMVLGPADLPAGLATIDAVLALRALVAEQALGPLAEVRAEPAVADRARDAARRVLDHPDASQLLSALSADAWLPELLDLAARLLWGRRHDGTRAVLRVARAIGRAGSRADLPARSWAATCAGYLALTDLTEHGPDGPTTTTEQLQRVGAGLLGVADDHLEAGDTRRASLVASAALWVLFHQELHDAAPTSPLVTDPAAWLRPLTASRVGQLLTRPRPPARPTTAPGTTAPTGTTEETDSTGQTDPTAPTRTHPLVLSGAYPRFAAPVTEALRADPRLRVTALPLSTVDKPFRRMAVEPWLVELRLRAGLGEPVRYEVLQDHLAGADTVLADWADAGAMLASLLTPPGTALTVRAHSVDALRCWLHLIDWSAVDQLICVGPHIQDLITAQLGERLSHARRTVLPNIVHLSRFDHPREPGTDHTLAMVGWSRAVKDPLWTVELLARLRRHDPRWRLLLIGHRFADVLPPSGRAYARRFAARARGADVHPAIEYVPFTDDLAPVLARAGWVVSSSIRESWGVGPMEAVAAGAVPVIRNWPLFARFGGPHRLYPEDWVVDSLDEAEQRMLGLTAAGRRSAVAEASRSRLADLIDPAAAAAGYRRALTTVAPACSGRTSSMPS